MADGSWKEISTLKPGDWLQGPTGPWEMDYLWNGKLGNRRMMSFTDRSVTWSDEHLFWTREGDRQWWWSTNPDQWRAEQQAGVIEGLFDNDSIMQGAHAELAHIEDVWVNKPVVDVTRMDSSRKIFLVSFTIFISSFVYPFSRNTSIWGITFRSMGYLYAIGYSSLASFTAFKRSPII